MSVVYGEVTLAEAAVVIQPSQMYQIRGGDEILNTLGMYIDTARVASSYKVMAVSGGQAVRNDAVSAAFDMVKSQVTHFVENTRILAMVLDEVGEVHPFIQGVSWSTLTMSVMTHPPHCSCGFFVQSRDQARNHSK